MRDRAIWTTLVLLGHLMLEISAETIRGVNLGGWLLVEEWYVAKACAQSAVDAKEVAG